MQQIKPTHLSFMYTINVCLLIYHLGVDLNVVKPASEQKCGALA